MHDVKDSRMTVLQLTLTDMAVTKTVNQCCKFSYRRGEKSFIYVLFWEITPSFSAAKEISISEQWQYRAVDEIMKFHSFLSHGCNTTTTFLHTVQADTCSITITSLFLKYNSLLMQTNPNITGEGSKSEGRGITTRDVFKYKHLLKQMNVYS